MILDKSLFHISKQDDVLSPFNTRGQCNLQIGKNYKVYCSKGYYDFWTLNSGGLIKIYNHTILLLLDKKLVDDQHIFDDAETDWDFHFLHDGSIITYTAADNLVHYQCNFIEVKE